MGSIIVADLHVKVSALQIDGILILLIQTEANVSLRMKGIYLTNIF
jgi:hypothetical protein